MAASKPTPPNLTKDSDADLRRRTPWNTISGRAICLVSRKGGVGKTTSAVNLGAALALSGHAVLVVGTDPQCGVCRTLGTSPEHLPHSLDDIFGEAGTPLTELALPSPLENLYYVSPRIISLADEEKYDANLTAHPEVLVREIDRARNFYDTILIDCPPNLGPATRASLLAADSYLVPVQAEELCRESIRPLLDFIDSFQARAYPAATTNATPAPTHEPISLEGIFLTMANSRTRMGRHVAARVAEDFGDWLFGVNIPRTTRLSEMALRGKPAVIYDRRSPGSRAYFDLADELVKRFANESASQDSLIDAMITSLGQSLTREQDSVEQESVVEPDTPEIVSLEDLLAEEESRNDTPHDDSWDEGYWSGDRGRVN